MTTRSGRRRANLWGTTCGLLIALANGGANGQGEAAKIERIWLTHRTNDPSKLVVNWTSPEAGDSVVRLAVGDGPWTETRVAGMETLHHVEVPLPRKNVEYRYVVRTGGRTSAEHRFQGYPDDVLKVAVAADWQGLPDLSALEKEGIHLLLTAGDNIAALHPGCGPGVKDCVQPYERLIDRYPSLFRRTPFLPALGNHDREIRPRGPKPPAEPVYDVSATAFRRFFALPDDGWKWRFDLPDFDLRFVALDLNHISDQGTTWQTCHPFQADSEQFAWYRRTMQDHGRSFVVTLFNERSGSMRGQEKGEWGRMFQQGTLAVTGFGYFAERAEVDGFPYFNTSLSGKGAKYADPQSKFIAGEDGYLLLTVTRNPPKLTAALKGLDGSILDETHYTPRR